MTEPVFWARGSRREIVGRLLLLLGYVLLGLFVFQVLAMMLAWPFLAIDMTRLEESLASLTTNPANRLGLYVIQSITSLGAFVLVGGLFISRVEPDRWNSLSFGRLHREDAWFLPLMYVVSGIGITVLETWNKGVVLPDFFSDFQRWAEATEAKAAELTQMLADIHTPAEYIMAYFTIALVAGTSEEFLFRGILQRQVVGLSGNVHAGIWITAFLFSAVHGQFFGLVPRMLLGVLFGYMYTHSRSLWVPMVAHTLNNGAALTLMLLARESGDAAWTSPDVSFPFWTLPLSALGAWGLYRLWQKRRPADELVLDS